MKNIETINKYLAGYLDGNGCITVLFEKRNHCNGSKPRLVVAMCGCVDYPKMEPMILEMFDHYGFGSIQRRANMIYWIISGVQAVSLINRIKQHLVVKGQHAERMLNLYSRYAGYGNYVTNPERLKKYVKMSRDNTGPLKPKNFASKAWTAGYIDSDGYLSHTQRCLDFGANKRDIAALALLSKTYGREVKEGREGEIRLRHHFPIKDKTLSKRILVPLLPHLRVKRWDAEQILSTRRD